MFEPQIIEIEKITWNGEDSVKILASDGCTFSGMKRKDFFNSEFDYENYLKPGSKLRYWAIQWSRVIGVEYLNNNGQWESLWVTGNDFPTREQIKKDEDEYINFIKTEGARIATWIDEGKSYEEIEESMDDEHSGNTAGWAINIGINTATNKENANKVRLAHNAFWGIKEDKGGIVNPAVLTIQEK